MTTTIEELKEQGAKFYWAPFENKENDPPHYYILNNEYWTIFNIDDEGTPEYMRIAFEAIAFPEVFT